MQVLSRIKNFTGMNRLKKEALKVFFRQCTTVKYDPDPIPADRPSQAPA